MKDARSWMHGTDRKAMTSPIEGWQTGFQLEIPNHEVVVISASLLTMTMNLSRK